MIRLPCTLNNGLDNFAEPLPAFAPSFERRLTGSISVAVLIREKKNLATESARERVIMEPAI
jgi:hypothetical protein